MEDGHFIDDPLAVVSVKPDFSGMGLSKKIENAIIIGDTVYELVDDSGENECLRCDFTMCDCISKPICVTLFRDDARRRRFKKTSQKVNP